MTGFSLSGLLWKQTLQVNLVRSVVAGFIWMIILIFLHIMDPASTLPLPALLLYPIAIPLAYFLFLLPFAIVAGWLSKMGVPFIGLVTFLPAMIIMPADPFVFFLHKAKPALVPTERYRFFEPATSIWVYENIVPNIMEQTAEFVKNKFKSNDQQTIDNCPYKGRILVDKDTKVMKFEWPAKGTAFEIKDDWSVETPSDRGYGWIDVNGEIHKGRPLGDINPNATLSGGGTGIKISGDGCWAGNEKIGELVSW